MEINWVFLIVAAIGIFVLISAFVSRSKANASLNWSGTQGTVTESFVQKMESYDSDQGSTTSYSPRVKYSYTVNQQAFEEDCIHFGVGKSSRKAAEEVVNRYPEGSTVMVYYDPQKPQQAVLERRTGSGFIQFAIGILMAVGGLVMAVKDLF
jgi:hypothetical protein